MKIEITLSPFDASMAAVARAAASAEAAGVTGLWTMDHLVGTVHAERRTVMECFASLGQLAAATEQCRIGPLVLNPVLRHPVLLAQSLASIDDASAGRLTVGLGAGGGGGDYGIELRSSGFVDHPAAVRRARVAETMGILDHLWSGRQTEWSSELYQFDGSDGFLVPKTRPTTIIAGFGPKMADMAGQLADGFNTSASHPEIASLAATARQAHERRSLPSPDLSAFEISAFAIFDETWLDPDSGPRRLLAEAGVDCLMLVLHAPPAGEPYDDGLIREIGAAATNDGAESPGR